MEGNVILTNEGVEQFENALSMLDSSLNELRKIADSMLPEMLVKDGLRAYLPAFCKSIEIERKIKLNLNFNSEYERVEESIESAVFRILKSLIGYILKYAEASVVTIYIELENKVLTLHVSNNGKGFDFSNPSILGSKEIAYIKLWVEIIKGRFLIIPEHNKGHEVIVEFNLKN